MTSVRSVVRADVPELSAVLGRAFADDPVWQWIFPRHPERMVGLFRLILLREHLPRGACELATDDGAVRAGALWDPPGTWRLPITTQLRVMPTLFHILGRRTFTVLSGLGEIERAHPKDPHWYLAILGTDPPAQGRGLGAALLESRLSRCDADRMPAFLESSKESNVPYYERFGFRVTGEFRLPDGPPLWPMWRDPTP